MQSPLLARALWPAALLCLLGISGCSQEQEASSEQSEAAVAPAPMAYVSNQNGNITVVDLTTFEAVSEIKKVGTQVKQGEPLMMIHYNDEAKLEQALEYFKAAYRLAPKRPTPPPLIVERVA